jgi:hypothetical protein
MTTKAERSLAFRKIEAWIGILFFGLTTLACVAGGVWFTAKALSLPHSHRLTVGTIAAIDHRVESAQDGLSHSYILIVHFMLPDGTSRTFEGGPAWWISVGDKVPVYYDADDPRDAVLGTFRAMWGPVLAYGIFAIVWALGTWAFVWGKRSVAGRQAKLAQRRADRFARRRK